MSKVYLAMYKARGNWVDKIIRLFTGKPYSHCELAIQFGDKYQCYSSSPRDGGVRTKPMHLSADKWDLIPLAISGQKATAFYQKTKGKKYDFIGAIGCVLPLRQKPSRYYCSEWCYEAVFGQAPKEAISPNRLARILKERTQ
ncbi:hypothetical protein L4F91_06700 [Avibacterium sp. 20-126]|uniref:hypothetical protein n=1 Tax=Avibacterium sp. 20-126 TaxID=2911524 RepID=UPI002184C365|nr:hypothetical protein L4F91_06700 [Avibacterium sp. 20-126]